MNIYLENVITILIYLTTIRISESLFCPYGERFSICGNNDCRPTCKFPQGPMFCDPICVPGCICTKGLVRRETDGKCVTLGECPQFSATKRPKPQPPGKRPHPPGGRPHFPGERPYPPGQPFYNPPSRPGYPPDERPYPPGGRPHPPGQHPHPLEERPRPPGGRPYPPEQPFYNPPPRPGYPPDERPYPPGGRPHPPGERPHTPGGRPYLPEQLFNNPPSRPGYLPDERPYPPGGRPHPPEQRPHPPGGRPHPPGQRPYHPDVRPLPPGGRPHPPGQRPYPPGQPHYNPPYRPGYPPDERPPKQDIPFDTDFTYRKLKKLNGDFSIENQNEELPAQSLCLPRPKGDADPPRQGSRLKGSCKRLSNRKDKVAKDKEEKDGRKEIEECIKKGEIFRWCGSEPRCQESCNPMNPKTRCNLKCNSGCYCYPGFVRKHVPSDMTCVHPRECPGGRAHNVMRHNNYMRGTGGCSPGRHLSCPLSAVRG